MPYRTEWVDNPVCLEHNGITIYHTYRNNDADDILLTYWFTQCPDSDENAFDVRELSTAKGKPLVHQGSDKAMEETIKAAIDSGEITNQYPSY